MTQTKKVIRAKCRTVAKQLGNSLAPAKRGGKLSPQDDDRRRGHDVSDLVISKRNASPRTRTAACLWVGIVVGHEMEIGRGLFNAAFGFSGYVEILGRFRV